MTGRKSGSVALFLVGFMCRGSTVCLLFGARSACGLLDGQAVFVDSVSGQGFPQFWVGHGDQVFCHGVVSVEGQKARQFTLVFGGLFPMCQS